MSDGPRPHGEPDAALPDVPLPDVPLPGEPPAALLRRAISHVESLLVRLDPAADATAAPGPRPVPAARRPSAEPSVVPPLPSPATAAEAAEALRSTLRAHEEALRSRARAGRAGDIARQERLLASEPTDGKDRAVEGRRPTDDPRTTARREAAAITTGAAADADRIREHALAQARAETRELLTAAHEAVADVRTAIQQLVDGLADSRTTLARATAAIDELLAPAPDDPAPHRRFDGSLNPRADGSAQHTRADGSAPHPRADGSAPHPHSDGTALHQRTRGPSAVELSTRPAGRALPRERRPLGLLFGAPRR